MTAEPLVTLNGVDKHFGETAVLSDVSFSVGRGEAIGVIGPSGGGKSTLLRCIDLLTAPDRGSITYHWASATARPAAAGIRMMSDAQPGQAPSIQGIRRDIGFVFQGLHLWSDRSVLHNLTLAPVVVLGMSRSAAEERARELTVRLGVGEKLDARVWELSGGQKQRVALARVLMMRPKLLLLDEVTSALDPLLVVDVMRLVRQLRDEGATMIIVTHQIEFAAQLCDRLVFLHEGQIIQIAAPRELLAHPTTPVVGDFLSTVRTAR